MLARRWTIDSPLPAAAVADRVRTLPRWNPHRDWFWDGTHLVAGTYPVEVTDDRFGFVIPSGRLWLTCRGQIHPTAGGSRVEVRVAPHPAFFRVIGLLVGSFVAVIVVGLWPVSPWLAIGGAVAAVVPGLLILTAAFWWNTRWARRRVTEALTGPADPPDRSAAGR